MPKETIDKANTHKPPSTPRTLGENTVRAASRHEQVAPKIPHEGDVLLLDGQKYMFVKVASGAQVYDPTEARMVPHYHTLKTFFSRSTDGIGPGPGWDTRMKLLGMLSEDMVARYGHVFTDDEIRSPMGYPDDDDSYELKGGMPDDIPFYELTPVDNE